MTWRTASGNIQTSERHANGNTVIFNSIWQKKREEWPDTLQVLEITPDKKSFGSCKIGRIWVRRPRLSFSINPANRKSLAHFNVDLDHACLFCLKGKAQTNRKTRNEAVPENPIHQRALNEPHLVWEYLLQ
jgi:hypothetical protein